jgi:hypothetical protein
VKEEDKEVALDIGASTTGAIFGFTIGGPLGLVMGAIISPVIADFGKRVLSPNEVSRVERFQRIVADKVTENLAGGGVLRSDLDSSEDIKRQIIQLFEGFLLKARGMYEEKKIPFLANLCARSFFTNTPLENILGSLNLAEELSYRQLVIVSLFNPFRVDASTNTSGLSQHSLGSVSHLIGDEYSIGVALDLWDLVRKGVLMQTSLDLVTPEVVISPGNIIPGRLELGYPGRLLHNGLILRDIPQDDRAPIIAVLSQIP